jgi:hypothetical protein
LFAAGRNIAPDFAEHFGAFKRAEAPGYLLVNLCHPDIVFALIAGKGHDILPEISCYIPATCPAEPSAP